jgi:hypothetical protein
VADGFTAAAAKSCSNANAINFGEVDSAADIIVTHAAVWDALTGGNMLVYGPLVAMRVFSPTDEAVIKVGKLVETVI